MIKEIDLVNVREKRNEEKVNVTSKIIFSFFESFLSLVSQGFFIDYLYDIRDGT